MVPVAWSRLGGVKSIVALPSSTPACPLFSRLSTTFVALCPGVSGGGSENVPP